MRLKLISVLLIFSFFFATALTMPPAHAQSQENFTLNFPQGNGTTTMVTFQSEQDKNVQNLVNGSIVAFVALVFLVIAYKKYKGI